MESILTSIKKLLGITEEYTQFDDDIVIHINSVLMDLVQLGVGPSTGFTISDKTATWTDFVHESIKIEAIKSYTYLRVKLLFDPPTNSSLITSINNQINKYEWLINVWAENGVSEDALRITELEAKTKELQEETDALRNTIDELQNKVAENQKSSELWTWFKESFLDTGYINSICKGKKLMTYFPSLDLRGITLFDSSFYECTGLKTVGDLDMTDGTNFTMLFFNCESLETIGNLTTPNGTVFRSVFSSCRKLTKIESIDTSNGVDFYYMFNGASSLETIPTLNLSKAESGLTYAFIGCLNLKNISVIGPIKIDMDFSYCQKLTTESAKNIILALANYKNTEYEYVHTITFAQEVIDNLMTGGNTSPTGGTWFDYIVDDLAWNI